MSDAHVGMAQLLTAGPILAAVVTAVFSIFKLFSDKAARTTEFRKAWVESFRLAVATFVGNTHTIFGRMAVRRQHSSGIIIVAADALNKLAQNIEFPEERRFDKAFESELTSHWLSLRTSYNQIILHINVQEHGAYLLAEAYLTALKDGRIKGDNDAASIAVYLDQCIDIASEQLLKYSQNFEPIDRSFNAHITKFCTLTLSAIKSVLFGPTAKWETPYEKLKSGLQTAKAYDLAPQETGAHFISSNKDFGQLIKEACSSHDAGLLLALFATREYLHDKYDIVAERRSRIERGIRVVDTASAMMLKETWEKIKNGEESYNRPAPAALVIVILFFSVVLMLAR